MRYLLSLFLLSLSSFCLAQSPEYSRVKIDLTETTLETLAKLGLEVDHGIIKQGAFIINDFHQSEIELLNSRSISHHILIDDVQHFYTHRDEYHNHDLEGHSLDLRNEDCEGSTVDPEGFDYPTPANYEFGSMGGYLTYDRALENLDKMRDLYPDLITVKTPISDFRTFENRPIYYFRISDNADIDEEEPEVIYTSLHHAREPNSLAQNLYFMWYLLENYNSDPEIKYLVDHTEMYFVPIVNPDGYVYNEVTNPNGGGLWRKNRRADDGEEAHGVDLNRNYGFFWGTDDVGSSPEKQSATYRGTEAFSEPETQAVKFLCEQHQFQLALNYHTFGNLMIHPWGYNDQPTEEDDLFKGIGRLMGRYNNYRLGTGTETVGYIVNGDTDDYMYGDVMGKNKIYSYTPEVGAGGFWPDPSQIDPYNKASMYQNLSLAYVTLNYGVADVVYDNEANEEGTGNGVVTLTKYGFEEGELVLTIDGIEGQESIVNLNQTTFNLDQLEDTVVNFTYELPSDFAGDYFFTVSVDNGDFDFIDTFKISSPIDMEGLETEVIYEDSLNSIDPFTIDGEWGLTSDDFVSEPSSMTDSPQGNYNRNSRNSIVVNEKFDLSEAVSAFLYFHAKWDIEEDYDYVQVQARSSSNPTWVSLCGNLTVLGSPDQVNEPLYDGRRTTWTGEMVSLDDFVGVEDIEIRFILVSDFGVEEDGFYFDNLQVFVDRLITSADDIYFDEKPTLFPNPSNDYIHFEFKSATIHPTHYSIYNVMGSPIMVHQSLSNGSKIEVNQLSEGMYYLKLEDGERVAIAPFQKM